MRLQRREGFSPHPRDWNMTTFALRGVEFGKGDKHGTLDIFF